MAEISDFALSYDDYTRHGGFDNVGDLANASAKRWELEGQLPDDLATARAALFFEQRRAHHVGEKPRGSKDHYVRALIERIHALSGGRVAGPDDDLL